MSERPAVFPAGLSPATGSAVAASRTGEDRIVRVAILLTLGFLALRLLTIGQFGLFMDEAYYWIWAQNLAWSYYDHPPLIAVTIWLSTALFGDGEFGVRALGTISIAIDAWLVFAITRTLYDSRRLAAWATIFFNVSVLTAASTILVPDQPMMVFWLGAMLGLARLARGGDGRWWLLVGLMGGLAALSKYTAFFLAAGIVLWLIVVPAMRPWLRSPWLWAGAALAVLLFLPVLWWNAQHGWSSFALQLGRSAFTEPRVLSFVALFATILILLNPAVTVLAVAGTLALIRRGWRDPRWTLLAASVLPFLAYLAYHSFSEWIGPHWLSPIFATGAILAAAGIDTARGAAARLLVASRRASIPIGIGIAVAASFFLVERFLPLPAGADFTARFRGWPEFAAEADRIRRESDAAYFVANEYGTVSWLTYNLRGEVPAYQLGEWERWEDFPAADPALADQTALYVGRWSRGYEAGNARLYFNTVRRGQDLIRPIRDGHFELVPTFIVSDPKPEAMALFGLGPPVEPAP